MVELRHGDMMTRNTLGLESYRITLLAGITEGFLTSLCFVLARITNSWLKQKKRASVLRDAEDVLLLSLLLLLHSKLDCVALLIIAK